MKRSVFAGLGFSVLRGLGARSIRDTYMHLEVSTGHHGAYQEAFSEDQARGESLSFLPEGKVSPTWRCVQRLTRRLRHFFNRHNYRI